MRERGRRRKPVGARGRVEAGRAWPPAVGHVFFLVLSLYDRSQKHRASPLCPAAACVSESARRGLDRPRQADLRSSLVNSLLGRLGASDLLRRCSAVVLVDVRVSECANTEIAGSSAELFLFGRELALTRLPRLSMERRAPPVPSASRPLPPPMALDTSFVDSLASTKR